MYSASWCNYPDAIQLYWLDVSENSRRVAVASASGTPPQPAGFPMTGPFIGLSVDCSSAFYTNRTSRIEKSKHLTEPKLPIEMPVLWLVGIRYWYWGCWYHEAGELLVRRRSSVHAWYILVCFISYNRLSINSSWLMQELNWGIFSGMLNSDKYLTRNVRFPALSSCDWWWMYTEYLPGWIYIQVLVIEAFLLFLIRYQ